ncbi:MAG: hypothetical protein SNJ72_11090, partial [Fimbriimonadales bacterium]
MRIRVLRREVSLQPVLTVWLCLTLSAAVGCQPKSTQSPQTSSLPKIERAEDGTYTIPPQVMTYGELAQLLTTPTRQVEAHPNLRQKGILVALQNRSWDELRRLLEYGLEVQFIKVDEAEGSERWQIVRHSDAERRDNLLFNRYVRIAHQRIMEQVRQFEPWFERPREALKSEHAVELEKINEIFTPGDEKPEHVPLTATQHDSLVRWFHILWVQSLDGYVMLQWMNRNWNEAYTRKLIQERMIVLQQPLTSGFPGIITRDDLLDFLKTVDPTALPAYDWTIGIVSWNPALRLVVPYCDILAPHAEGTQWMLFPITLAVEPPSWQTLWQQLGDEAQAYRNLLSKRQETLRNDPDLTTKFPSKDANSLSQLLESWAKTTQREVLMELAPEREPNPLPTTAHLTLRELAQPDLSRWLAPEADAPPWGGFLIIHHILEPTSVGKSLNQIAHDGLEQALSSWHYEIHEGVLIARNSLAFLDRQYTYPLDALFQLERARPQAKHDLDAHLQRLGNFAWAILRQPDHGIALLDYRGAPIMAQPEGLAALAILASLPASERRSILKRLQKDKTAEISLQRVGTERLDALTKFWRRNTLLPNSSEPFGFRNAWHPRFRVRLR